jgi:hypothetical protein
MWIGMAFDPQSAPKVDPRIAASHWCFQVYGLKKLDGCDVVVFRGSITLQDWLCDLFVLPLPALIPELTRIGHVHAGFFLGMEKAWGEQQFKWRPLGAAFNASSRAFDTRSEGFCT